jgi:penicillin-binding protein 1C
MPVKVAGGVLPLTVMLNWRLGRRIDSRRSGWLTARAGFARLTVIDATGAADTVVIRVQ